MTTIIKNIDLNSGANRFDGWETCAASGKNIVVYSGNWFAAYSRDNGETFSPLDPNGICQSYGEDLCCDQVVIYSPQINNFIWVMQTTSGNYVLAFATPEEIDSSAGKKWFTYYIPSKLFAPPTELNKLDFPEVALGDNFLYMTCMLYGIFPKLTTKFAVGIRISLENISTRRGLAGAWFGVRDTWGLRPAQSTGSVGFFVSQNSTSELGMFRWPESGSISRFKIPISTIPTEDWEVKFPDGSLPNWLSTDPKFPSKISARITGLTLAGSELWVAWSAARKVAGRQVDTAPYPHIGIAVIDVDKMKLVREEYIWNSQHAFAWPALATNRNGEVGLSFCWGGNKWYAHHGVGILSPRRSLVSTTSGVTTGAGGHYISIRRDFPREDQFSSSGFNQIKESGSLINHPHYVVFKN